MDETNKGFMKHLGGLELKQISETQYEFIVEVKEMHLNTGKIAHGGFLSTIADTGMGTAAHRIIHKKSVLGTKFVPDVLLLGVRRLFHLLAAARAIDVGVSTPFPTFFCVTSVQQMTILGCFQLMDFVLIKPQPLAAGAAINGNSLMRDLLHTVLAFGTL